MADTLLLYSVAQGDVHQVSTLIVEANADVNYQNNVGTTACHVTPNPFSSTHPEDSSSKWISFNYGITTLSWCKSKCKTSR